MEFLIDGYKYVGSAAKDVVRKLKAKGFKAHVYGASRTYVYAKKKVKKCGVAKKTKGLLQAHLRHVTIKKMIDGRERGTLRGKCPR
jgi:hypothetical protein